MSTPLVPRGRIGVQLYSLREEVERLGLRAVLARVAEIGYETVELAGYAPLTAEDVRGLLDEYGLRAIGTHVRWETLSADVARALSDAETLGVPHLGTADSPGSVGGGETSEGYGRAAEAFNEVGAQAAARGLRFYHHNHDGEFAFDPASGERLYDVLLAETDATLVSFELDLLWAYVGAHRFPGFDPVELVTARPERYPLFHVKDGVSTADPAGYAMTDVGEGELDFRRFFSALSDRDAHHYVVERDDAAAAPGGAFTSVERSLRHLERLEA